ncbi:MATE family efflux transporter [Vibrio breoganii]
MLFTLIATLYVSRIVFQELGIVDYGIYNVVAGIATMFVFINSAMSSATQRFLSYELGKSDTSQVKKTFNMTLTVHIIIAVLIVILVELVGLWLINNHLNIDQERLSAANWVFHCVVIGLVFTILGVPYNASIIATEKMKIFAIIGTVDVFIKLALVYYLTYSTGDKLEVYAGIALINTMIIWFLHFIYCRVNISFTKYTLYWDVTLFKRLISYTGWNLFGNLSGIAANQGVNILLNLFFGPVVNGSRAIVTQMNVAVKGFVSNLQMSINPQIIKSYAAGDLVYLESLVMKGGRYSFYLVLVIAMPFFIKADDVILLWLGNVPKYSVDFIRLALLDTLVISVSGGLMAALQATGNIKKYQITVGGVLLLNLPIALLLLYLDLEPQVVYLVSISLSLLALYARLHFVEIQNGISKFVFFKCVIYRCFIVLVLTSIFNSFAITNFSELILLDVVITTIITSIITLFVVYLFGLECDEKMFIKNKLIKFGIRKNDN